MLLFIVKAFVVLLCCGSAVAIAVAAWSEWREVHEYGDVVSRLEAAAPAAQDGTFGPAAISGLPLVARRYFAFSIAPGTALHNRVELQMKGSFDLGDKDQPRTFDMQASEVLAPPAAFVWRPRLTSGPVWVGGSDGLFGDRAWTRFRLMSLITVADTVTSPDIVRSAVTRSILEAIWAPASLLPSNGARWTQLDEDRADIAFTVASESFNMH